MGAFEILYSETPDRVAINEAVDLAKRFGSKQSAQFVNGILDRLLSGHERRDTSPPAAEPETKAPRKSRSRASATA